MFGAVLPLVASAWLADVLADRQSKALLHAYAEDALATLRRALSDSHDALFEVAALNGCETDHIAIMRRLVMTSSYVDEVGYFEGGQLACTSWGLAPPGIGPGKMDFSTATGLQIRARLNPAVTGAGPSIGVHFGNHNVLISQKRLTDLLKAGDVELVLAYQPAGRAPVLLGGDAENLVLLSSHQAPHEHAHADTAHFSDVVRDGPFVAAAQMLHTDRHSTLHREQMFTLLPLGGALSLVIVANIYWLSRRKLNFRNETRAALRGGEFRMVYQPVFDLRSGACVGAEALIRWQRHDGTHIRPDVFLPIAEVAGFIPDITRFAIETVCKDMGALLRAQPDLHIAVNLSAQDLSEGSLLKVLETQLGKARIDPKSIWLELTERALVDPARARETLDALRSAGHRIAIDDFGTGYSSLGYLQTLPIDALKIDKSFIDSVGMQSANASVIHHIIELGSSLGLSLVGEGIETQEQLDYLRSRGVGFGQGYLMSKPLEAAAFLALVRSQAWADGRTASVETPSIG